MSEKDVAYWERNQLVAALSKIYPSFLAKHPEGDTEWEDDWRNIVVINLPIEATVLKDDEGQTGGYLQMTWHIHDFDRPMFDHLNLMGSFIWDGHSIEEKYRRLRTIKAL